MTSEARERSFETFYRIMLPPVRAFATRRAPRVIAEDVIADTFLVAWRRWDEAQVGGLPWLYRTAQFSLANRLRAERRQHVLVSRIGAEPEPGASTDADDTSIVGAAIATLDEKDRNLLLLVYWEHLSLKAVAGVLDCSPGAAAVRLHRARAKLRAALSKPPVDPQARNAFQAAKKIEVTP